MDLSGKTITSATLTFKNISNWDANTNRLFIHLLDTARNAIKATGITPGNRDVLFRAAHDMKGQAATFGFPQVAPVADSLCRLIEHTPDLDRIPYPLIDQHVDAVRAIIREHSRPDAAATAEALTKKLRDVTDNFLLQVNRDRPDYVATVLSPPTAPNEGMF